MKPRHTASPQFVIVMSHKSNAVFFVASSGHGNSHKPAHWIGDAASATKFPSRYAAKQMRESAAYIAQDMNVWIWKLS